MRQIIKKIIQIGSLVWVGYIPAQLIVLQQALDAPNFKVNDDCLATLDKITYADNAKKNNLYHTFRIDSKYQASPVDFYLTEADAKAEMLEQVIKFDLAECNGGFIIGGCKYPRSHTLSFEYEHHTEPTDYWGYGVMGWNGSTNQWDVLKYEISIQNGKKREKGATTCSFLKGSTVSDAIKNNCIAEFEPGGSKYDIRLKAEAYSKRKYPYTQIRIGPVDYVTGVSYTDKTTCKIEFY